jgi:hypothetical protein
VTRTIFHSTNSMREGDSDLRRPIVIMLISMKKLDFASVCPGHVSLFDFVTARTVVSARLGFLVYFFSTVRFWSLAALLLIFSLSISVGSTPPRFALAHWSGTVSKRC